MALTPVPPTLVRGHQGWSTWAETPPGQTGYTGISKSSLLRLRALPSTSYRESLITSALLGHSSSVKVLQAAGNLFPPFGKMGSHYSQVRRGPTGNSLFLCSHCKATSATRTPAILAASARALILPSQGESRQQKDPLLPSSATAAPVTSVFLVLWDEFWSYFTCWNCWRNRTKSKQM